MIKYCLHGFTSVRGSHRRSPGAIRSSEGVDVITKVLKLEEIGMLIELENV